MISLDTAAAIAAAPTNTSLDPVLRRLLADRVRDWGATGLLNLTHVLIVQAGDIEQDIVSEIGFSPLVNPIDERRFGSSDFQPHHDWLERHDGWFELIFTVSNSGFAFVIFVADIEGVDPQLLGLCRSCAGR
jgi:hypothetical protein